MDWNAILQIVLTGIFGGGGLVAFYAIWSTNHTKKYDLAEHEKLKEDNISLKKEVEELTAKESELEVKRIPLTYHPLFNTLDEIEFFFRYNFKLADEGRTMIVREMCINKLIIWRKVIRRYVDDSQQCYLECESEKYLSCNKSELEMSRMLLEGLEEYTKMFDGNNMFDVTGKIKYDSESLETMQVFLPIFRDWHYSREEIVRLSSHEIPNSGLNRDCHGDWWDVLSVYAYAFTQMKYDAVRAMAQLNGELTGRKFLGVIIGDDH